MTIEDALYWGQQALILVLFVCGPPMLAALVVGLTISLFQAVTQVNEMTLVFIPKILAVFLALWLMGDWMLQHTVNFGQLCIESIADIE